MIIDCISDLHGELPKLEGGDLLIISGDLWGDHYSGEYGKFECWLDAQDYKKKVFIAGNHDRYIENKGYWEYYNHMKPCLYLEETGTEFEGLKIWGTPWTPHFEGIHPHCAAFMLPENKLEEKYALIPDDTDILITHGPPYGILDKTHCGESVGSLALRKRLATGLKPKLHVFGHIHEGYGEHVPEGNEPFAGTRFVNCAFMNERYKPVNKPIRGML